MWTCINNENESEIRLCLKPYTKINYKEDKDLNVGQILCKFKDNIGGAGYNPHTGGVIVSIRLFFPLGLLGSAPSQMSYHMLTEYFTVF